MKVLPQPDGSLHIEAPDENTRFDMGNRQLFVTFDGSGDATRIFFCRGAEAGSWRLHIAADGLPVTFHQARALGRLWELNSNQEDLQIDLMTFLEDASPIVYQQCIFINRSDHLQQLRVKLELDFHPSISYQQRILNWGVRNLPRFLRLKRLWGEGWGKALQPSMARQVSLLPNGLIQAQGDPPLTWGATQQPSAIHPRYRAFDIFFELDLPVGEKKDLCWALSIGNVQALEIALARREAAFDDARSYANWLSFQWPSGDRLQKSLFVSGLNAALAMFKEFPEDFAGLVAGPDYAYPPRLYFRDGYWTAQILLRFRPDLVRLHLLSLTRGVHRDGHCPSGVFAPHLFTTLGMDSPIALDWLPDHIDAPAFFLLLLDEYLQATGDMTLLDENLPPPLDWKKGRPALESPWTIWRAAQQAVNYLVSSDRDGDGLIEKSYKPNDWADNVRRSIWVTYDQALYAAALQAAGRIAALREEDSNSTYYYGKSIQAQQALHNHLWDEGRGHYVNYCRPGLIESHFSIDTLLILRYKLAHEDRARRMLRAARCLQTRHNSIQPYGDWGVMSVFPPYGRQADLFSKSADPYRYHNGADWPYWDGVYAECLKAHGDPDWVYVLTRWWEYGLAQGWLTPVEYFSPPHPAGGMLQGWSSFPAVVLAQNEGEGTIQERAFSVDAEP